MKKERIMLKVWVEEVLIIAQVFLLILLTGECETINMELAIKFPAIVLLLVNHTLLARYTDFYTKGF